MEHAATLTAEHTAHAHDEHRDDQGSKLGMWLFLFTEILLFGGLFIVYAIYRFMNHEEFSLASHQLDKAFGAFNTVLLICSSFTVAAAITAIQKGKKQLAINMLVFTVFVAFAFMVHKYFEWGYKINHGLFPGTEHFAAMTNGEQLFFLLYYFMTGLHGLHVVIGAVFIIVVIYRIIDGRINADNFQLLENSGLYWHLVDLIWIYLFPLMYLII